MDWLFKDDIYVSEDDNSSFMDKSSMSILKILSRIQKSNKKREGILYKINPAIKLLSSIIIVILVTVSRNFNFDLAVIAFEIINMFLLTHEDRKAIVMLLFLVPLFTFIMLIPSMLMGNLTNSLILVMKVALTINIINILSHTAKWNSMVKALKLFFIPDIFIFVFEITLKYIYLLGQISIDMLNALKLRSIGKNRKKYNSMAGIMGNLFIKSREMGEEMYSAMECRGFTGEYSLSLDYRFGFWDLIYIMLVTAVILLFLIWQVKIL